MSDLHGLIHRMADELDHYRQLLTDDRREVHPLSTEARAVLAAEQQGEGLTDNEIAQHLIAAGVDALEGEPDGTCRTYWQGWHEEIMNGIRAAIAADRARSGRPTTTTEDLAARPLLEQVARLGDLIDDNTVGEIKAWELVHHLVAISDRAADWLRDNPPGQPVTIEPRGCPTPGACSCMEPAPMLAELLPAYQAGRRDAEADAQQAAEAAQEPPADGDVAMALVAENRKLRAAGCNLAEAAIRVAREYDGVHRLMLTVSEWAKAVADEGGRGEVVAHVLAEQQGEDLTDEELLRLAANALGYISTPPWDMEATPMDADEVLTIARAAIAADRARWGHPAAPPPNDLSHLSEEQFRTLCPQGYHGVGAGPAVPEGMEPASVAQQATAGEGLTDYRETWDMSTIDGSLCFASSILSRLVGVDNARSADEQWLAAYLRANCMAALATRLSPTPPPVEGEVAELVRELGRICFDVAPCDADTITRAADLLERQHQVADLAADAVSALRYIEQSHGRLYGVGFDRVYEKADRLRPAHALPLPATTEHHD